MNASAHNDSPDFPFDEQLQVFTSRPPYHGTPRVAQTHQDRALIMASLPMTALGALLQDAAERMDTAWLQSAMVMGMFDFSREMTVDGRADQSLDALEKTMAFTKQCTNGPAETDPLHGDLDDRPRVAYLRRSPAFEAFYPEFVDHVLKEVRSSRHQFSESSRTGAANLFDRTMGLLRIKDLMGRMLIGACALGLPESARAIVLAEPTLASKGYPLDALGEAVQFMHEEHYPQEYKESWGFTPSFFAMQLGSLDCLRAIEQASGREALPMAIFTKPMERGSSLSIDTKEIDLLGVMDVITPTCLPNVLTTLLKERMRDARPVSEGGPDLVKLHSHAIGSLGEMGQRDGTSAYTISFLACGAYDIDPTKSVAEAVSYGNADIVREVEGAIDWASVFLKDDEQHENSRIIQSARRGFEEGGMKNHDDAMAAAIERAVREDRSDLVLFSQVEDNRTRSEEFFNHCGERVTQPMALLVEHNYQGAMLALLKAGLNVQEPLHPGTLSVAAMADGSNPEMANLIHAFCARKQAMALLGEIDNAGVAVKKAHP